MHDLPQPRRARALGRQPARGARPVVHDLPQRARRTSPSKQLKEKTQAALCATCHRDKIAKLDRSGHMPVREGKMQCTHVPQRARRDQRRLLRKGDSIAELCTSCHADKRGPYLWEHAPSRDGCVTCHDPHGSSNERMLVAKPPILCQRCHVATRHPSTIYDAALIGAGATPSVRDLRPVVRHLSLGDSRVEPSRAANGSFDERGAARHAHLDTAFSVACARARSGGHRGRAGGRAAARSALGTSGPNGGFDRLRRARDVGRRRRGTLRALSRSRRRRRSSSSSG